MAIDNVRLPVTVEEGALGGPRFKTTTNVALSGVEQRVSEWDHARCEYDIKYGIKSKEDLLSVIKIHRARVGSAYPFRFKDWSDYEATTVNIGTGDGSDTTYQLVKKYSDGVAEVTRTILLPVSGTVSIYVNGVLQTVTTHYSINYSTGVVTFVSPPTNTHPITATFEFDVPVRFADDALDVAMLVDDFGEIPSIMLIEVLGE
jgi:uncharacterized protein (TIGR02217 family)